MAFYQISEQCVQSLLVSGSGMCVGLCVCMFVANRVVQQQLEESQKDQTAEENGAVSHFSFSHTKRERERERDERCQGTAIMQKHVTMKRKKNGS